MEKIYKIGAAIIRDRKLLIVKEQDWKMYGVPGGKIKPGESDTDCLKRELQEELKVNTKNFEYIGTFEDKAMNEPKIVQIKFYKVEISGEPKKSKDIEDMCWFGRNDDWNMLGPIDKNHLLPELVKRKII